MKPAPFKYVRADSVEEALSVLAKFGDDVRVVAGGQSLGAMLNMRIVTPTIVLDINRIIGLSKIESGADIVTGAMVRQADALSNSAIRRHVGLLAQALPHVGHYQTRNRGTLGGSVAHADPSAEIPLVLATLGGEIELRSARRVRRVAAKQFFRSALVTIRGGDELVTALHWPRASSDLDAAFFEFAVREGDFAIVAVACAFERGARRMRLGFGGCGEVPHVVEVSAPSGTNANWVEEIARELSKQLDFRSDLLASANYRRSLATVLARKAMIASIEKARAYA
ncbi:MAG TPA: FAD binding domain-containing protein [Xanthobacteraceae bacterium]|nr:FAD binding domain-containing protein [Xanthobacteraceae bacterium]